MQPHKWNFMPNVLYHQSDDANKSCSLLERCIILYIKALELGAQPSHPRQSKIFHLLD
jgi:hypothetical protein